MDNEEIVEVIELEVLAHAIVEFHGHLSDKSLGAVDLATLSHTLLDVNAGQKMLSELGLKGSYYVKSINGVQYVILRGSAGLREALKGTKYLPTNPKVIAMGLGPNALKIAARSSGLIMIVAYTALDVTGYILSDQQTLSELFSNLIVDVAIGAVALAAGVLFAASIASIATVAVPAAVGISGAIVVGMFVSSALSFATNKLQLKKNISIAIDWTIKGLRDGLLRLNEVVINANHTIREKYRHLNRRIGQFEYDLEREITWRFYPRAFHRIYR